MKIDLEIIKTIEKSSKIHSGICKICIYNKLDRDNAIELGTILQTLIQGGITKIVFDLGELKYVDSTGIGRIITITKYLRKIKGDVTITRCSPHLMEVFRLVRLENFIKIFDSYEQGLNYIKFI
ncbi:MAG: STAS domain-containing protein [Spirochaetes bacterium]|nr:STAS domain-containing protein [Spirochaetota bacterium]